MKTKAISCGLIAAFMLGAGGAVSAQPVRRGGLPGDEYWWRGATFYEVFVRSFADSTEGPLAGDGVGDLRGLIENLDYLNDGDPQTQGDLNVDALWLMPIHQSPSYHGYDVVDYFAVDDEYGTNEDFKDLIAACEDRGMRVVIDLVVNHSSSDHPWFRESVDPGSSKRDWYVWERRDPDWPGPWGQDVWHENPEGPGHYYGVFWGGMPDFNHRNPAVAREFGDIIEFWIDEMGTHGFRLDAIKHMIENGPDQQENTPDTRAWLAQFMQECRRIDPEAFVVGEVWSNTGEASSYVPRSVDSVFEFDTAFKLLNGINDGDAAEFVTQLPINDKAYRDQRMSTFLHNHDMDRAMSRFGGATADGFAKSKLAATVQFTIPGIPFIYYGEEIGMTGTKPDPEIRTPMQWAPDRARGGFTSGEPWKAINENVDTVNVLTQSLDQDSLLNLYRKLTRLRDGSEALRIGEVRVLQTGDDRVAAYVRQYRGEVVLVVANFAGEEVACPGLSFPRTRLSRNAAGEDGLVRPVELLSGVEIEPIRPSSSGRVRDWAPVETLGAREALVIQLRPAAR